jgi:hypothetical protein
MEERAMTREHYKRRDKREQHDLDEKREPENLVKSYPSLPYATQCHLPIVAFDKLDGSNVRAEWTKKKGWHKFGTRNRLVDSTDPVFGKVPQLIEAKYGTSLGHALLAAGYERAMCFFEFWGPGSFAGMHDTTEAQTVTLFDVAPFTKGILEPELFLRQFGHLDVAKVLYRGELTPGFIDSVRSSTLSGMTFEGVVCKAANDKKTKAPIMFKQKSKAWLDKLGAYCGDNKDLFNALI